MPGAAASVAAAAAAVPTCRSAGCGPAAGAPSGCAGLCCLCGAPAGAASGLGAAGGFVGEGLDGEAFEAHAASSMAATPDVMTGLGGDIAL